LPLNIVFVFIDIIGLLILYGVLFFYLRVQLRNLHVVTNSSDHDHQIILEHGSNVQFPTSGISMTKPVTVTPEEYHSRRGPEPLRPTPAERRMNQVCLTLLLYPLVYIIVLLPLSIVRVMQFENKNPNLKASHIVCGIFDCQGFINVLLYTCTRKGIIPWNTLLRKFKQNPMSPKSDHATDTSGTVVSKPSISSLNLSKFPVEHSTSASYVTVGNVTSDDDKFGHEYISV
jgi:hypothetical protein